MGESEIIALYSAVRDRAQQLQSLAAEERWDDFLHEAAFFGEQSGALLAVDWHTLTPQAQTQLAALMTQIQAILSGVEAPAQAWRNELIEVLQGVSNRSKLVRAYGER